MLGVSPVSVEVKFIGPVALPNWVLLSLIVGAVFVLHTSPYWVIGELPILMIIQLKVAVVVVTLAGGIKILIFAGSFFGVLKMTVLP